MDDTQNASQETVVAGDADGASIVEDGDSQQNSGRDNGESQSPGGVAGGTGATDDTDPNAIAETDDAPTEIPVYHVFYRDGYAVVPHDFPPTKGDRNGNPTLTLPGIRDLHRDFYAINLYTVGPLLDKEQRNDAGHIVPIHSRNTPTEDNIERCRRDLHKMLEEMWKRMPAYFDTTMAEVAKQDERLCDKETRDKICTGKQVMSIISRLSVLTEEGRYGELMAICYRYFNVLSRETGRTSWVKSSVLDFGRRFGYPFIFGPVPNNEKKRGPKLCRLAKSWATRSILQAFRNGQEGWYGCRMFFRDPSAAIRAKKPDGQWQQYDIGEYIDPKDCTALKSSRGDKKGTRFWIWHKCAVDPLVSLRARLMAANEAAYVEGISRSDWEKTFQQALAKSPYGCLKSGTDDQHDEDKEKEVPRPEDTNPEEKEVVQEPDTTNDEEVAGPEDVPASLTSVLPVDNPAEKQVVPAQGGAEEKEDTGPEDVLAPLLPVIPVLNLTPAVPQTLVTPSVQPRENGPEDQPPAGEAKNGNPPPPEKPLEPIDRSEDSPKTDEAPKAPRVDPRKKKEQVNRASKKRSAGGSGLADRMKKAINEENKKEEQEKAKTARKKREYAKRTGVAKNWGRGMRKKFGAYGCCNCFAEKVDCVMVICRFCGEDIKKELEIKEGEKEEDHQVRTSGIETEWMWKELENCAERRCDHRFSNLKYWEDQKEVGRRRPNCPLVARDCIVCGDEL